MISDDIVGLSLLLLPHHAIDTFQPKWEPLSWFSMQIFQFYFMTTNAFCGHTKGLKYCWLKTWWLTYRRKLPTALLDVQIWFDMIWTTKLIICDILPSQIIASLKPDMSESRRRREGTWQARLEDWPANNWDKTKYLLVCAIKLLEYAIPAALCRHGRSPLQESHKNPDHRLQKAHGKPKNMYSGGKDPMQCAVHIAQCILCSN